MAEFEGGIPQPPGWPILGNLFEINPSQAIKSLFRLRDNYGIFSHSHPFV